MVSTEKVKRMLDACYLAKRIRELLPPLPEGVTPAYIQYMDVIHSIQKEGKKVKVSDISDAMNLPRPGVTRTVKGMEEKGYLRKYSSDEDGRVTYIAITEKGEALSEKYDKNYYDRLAEYLDRVSGTEIDISEAEADCMIQTIQKFYTIMKEGGTHLE